MTRQLIISLTPGIKEAIARAQRMANDKNEAQGVWEHVGCYGYPSGDIPARHTFKVIALSKPDPDTKVWALVATADPGEWS